MKKILAGAFALSLAGSAMAAGNVGFEVGTNWFKPGFDPNNSAIYWGASNGQNFTIVWGLDNDLWLGAYTENTVISDGNGNELNFNVTAIQIAKGVMKNVSIGLNVGSFMEDWNTETGALTDVFGKVTILSGSGDKVSGNVNATVAGRWADDRWNGGDNWTGYNINLSVGLLF